MKRAQSLNDCARSVLRNDVLTRYRHQRASDLIGPVCVSLPSVLRSPVPTDSPARPIEPVRIAAQLFEYASGEILRRVRYRFAERFKQLRRNQNGNVMSLESKKARR